MGLVETEGLILKSYSLAEADKIVILLTQNEGLVRGVARGAKRLKSRFGGGLEVFTIVQISYFQKEERELVSIRNIELLRSYFEKASDPDFFENLAYLTELIVEFAQPHDPNEKLYRMTKACLEVAANNPSDFESIVLYFEIWLLRLGGYLPDWKICSVCKREFRENEPSNLQVNFHLICSNCQKGKNNWVITSAKKQIYLTAQRLAPVKFLEFTKNQKEDTKEISIILRRLISNILGKEIEGGKKLVAKS
jgi:DNA repair protein RecO (recombination protein O)